MEVNCADLPLSVPNSADSFTFLLWEASRSLMMKSMLLQASEETQTLTHLSLCLG